MWGTSINNELILENKTKWNHPKLIPNFSAKLCICYMYSTAVLTSL